MKKIKNILILVMLLCGTFLLVGCGKDKKIEGTLEDLMSQIYENIPEDERPMMLMNTEVTSENIDYYLGTSEIEYEEALASESGVGSIAHSVVLLRTKENADVEKVKNAIKENVNPRKWICVGVDEKDVIVENKENLVILILVEDKSTREKLEKGFNSL